MQPIGRRQCPRCSKPIERSELVVFDGGELFHQRCYLQNGGGYEIVVEFLRREKPSSFCHTCLTRILLMTYDDIRKIVIALRIDRDFSVLLGARCAGCRQPRVTVQAI